MPAKIEYAVTAQFHIIRLSGDIRYGDVVALQQFVEKLKSQPLPFIIDLTQSTHLDSTALGTLALISKHSQENNVCKATIYVTDPVVTETLLGVCFDRVFSIQTEFPKLSDSTFSEVEPVSPNEDELAMTVKAAHRTLAEISESNELLFQDVNALLQNK